jgi:hypothetical protein
VAELVTLWCASGLSQRAFALEHGVTQKQISYWSRSLAAKMPLPGFVPVRVMPSAAAVAISLRSEHGWMDGCLAGRRFKVHLNPDVSINDATAPASNSPGFKRAA